MHELANAIHFESTQKAPHFYLHHPLLMEKVYEERVQKEEKATKTSRQYSSRTEMKKTESVLSKRVLQEKVTKHLEKMTPEGRRQFVNNSLKPLMAAHHGLTNGALKKSSDSDEGHEVNILCYMTKIFCRSMNMQSEDELLQTLVMQTNQNYLSKQQEGYNKLANSEKKAQKSGSWGSWKFWTAVGAIGVVGGVLLVGSVCTAALFVSLATIATGGMASILLAGAVAAVALPIVLTVLGGVGAYFGFKYGGHKDADTGQSTDTPNTGGVNQGLLSYTSSLTQAINVTCENLNNTIQQSSKRVEDDSTQTNQEGNYVQQAIQDLAVVMKTGN